MIRKISLIWIILVLFISVLIQYDYIEAQNYSNFSKQFSNIYLDSIIEGIMENQNIPGVSACAVKDGEIIWSGHYGYANISQNIPVSESISFMLGSTSKTITGTAFMQLYEDGLIGLDDDINDYLPFQVHHPLYPQEVITPRMLLSHVSGIRDNWDILNIVHYPGGDSPIPLSVFTEGYLTPGGQYYNIENFTTSAPATAYEYTNVGTTLIAYIIEVISNLTFEQYCQENIFIPLEMTETSWFLANLNLINVAMPYTFNNGNFIPFGHYGSPIYPCGFLRTSSDHLARYLITFIQKGHFNGIEILDSTSVELMSTLHYPDIAPEYGLQYQIVDGLIGHVGGGPGVNSIMFFNPATNAGAIVITNIENYFAMGLIFDEVFQYAEEFVTNIHISSTVGNTNLNVFPNPTKSNVTIKYSLESACRVKLNILDSSGKLVKTLVDTKQQQGTHKTSWDGFNYSSQSVPAGVYYCTIQISDNAQSIKLIKTNKL